MIMMFLITALIRAIHTLQADEGKLYGNPAFLKATQIYFQIGVKVMELFPITSLIRATHLPFQVNQQHQMKCVDQIPISIWYIGTHKEQLQRLLQSRHPSYKMTLTS